MLAIGNEELGSSVKKGDKVFKGSLSGILEYGKDESTGKETNLLGYVKVGDACYLASIKDQLVLGWEKAL